MSYIKHMLVASLFVLSACGDAPPPSEAVAGDRVAVQEVRFVRSAAGDRILTGKLYNHTGAAISNAQIQVSLLDGEHRRISSMHIRVKDVPAGNYRAFRAPVESQHDVQSAKVRSVLLL